MLLLVLLNVSFCSLFKFIFSSEILIFTENLLLFHFLVLSLFSHQISSLFHKEKIDSNLFHQNKQKIKIKKEIYSIVFYSIGYSSPSCWFYGQHWILIWVSKRLYFYFVSFSKFYVSLFLDWRMVLDALST